MRNDAGFGPRGGVVADADTHLTTGFLAGTMMLTQDGELPVEYLGIGDKIITRDAGYAKVTEINAERRKANIVRIRAGSLGHTRPGFDINLPGRQRLLLRDWRAQTLFGRSAALIEAERLVDGEFVTRLGRLDVTIYKISCDAPHIFYAGGLEVEGGTRTPISA